MPATKESNVSDTVRNIIIRLYEENAVKFGDFTLKSGVQSPVYFDLRVMISFPSIMVDVAQLLWEASEGCKFKSICGVPYTALPIATLMSAKESVPMLIRRKEAKGYGTKKLIEGKYEKGDKCLIVEDVVSSGSSILETVESLKTEGIEVEHAVVLLNREQGGYEKLAANGIRLFSVFTMTDVLCVLRDAGRMEADMVQKVSEYIETNTFDPNEIVPSAVNVKPRPLAYDQRAAIVKNPVTRRLLEIMDTKKSNLVVSADFTSAKQVLELVEKTGPYICMVKTHVDILEDFSDDFVQKLKALAAKHNILIFEDRKFADIGNTVLHQYGGGMYHISEWADIVNAHVVPGEGVIKGLKKIGQPKGAGCVLIAEMSSAGNLATGDYTQAAVKMAEANSDYVMGFISVSQVSSNPEFLNMTPGVQLQEGEDSLGQQYLTPAEVITNRASDLIIVGRGIYEAADPAAAAKEFQNAGYEAYLARLSDQKMCS